MHRAARVLSFASAPAVPLAPVLVPVLAVVLALGLVGLASPPPLAAQGADMAEVQIETIAVADGVWMLVGRGGNIGVSAGDDGIFLIDDQYAPLTEKIRAAVAAISDGPIRFVLNTHWHGDHTGGNENLGRTGTLIVAHDHVRERMSTDQFIAAFGQPVPAAPDVALPVVTFDSTVTFHLNGETIHAFHVPPAHTDGDSVVVFRDVDVIHAGDLFFNGFYPFIDVGSGGSIGGMIAAGERLLAEAGPETKIIPGHGPLASREDLASYVDMLRGVRGAVNALVVQGKSLEEVQAADPLAPWNGTWGDGFLSPERFTAIVYQSLRSGG